MSSDLELQKLYKAALERVSKRGWDHEVDYFRKLRFEDVDGKFFFREYAFCVYAAGFENYIVNKKWPSLTKAYEDWDYDQVYHNQNQALQESLKIINHKGKANAILNCAQKLHHRGWPWFRDWLLKKNLLVRPGELNYIGSAVRYHLARNIGADVAKPDRYILDYASQYGYFTTDVGVQQFANRIAKLVGERPGVIDYVLWRDYEGSLYIGSMRSQSMKE